MRCCFRTLAATVVPLAAVLAACSSTQTSLNAPTSDKCQVTASNSPSAFTATGGQGTLAVVTARDCTWSITTNASWVAISGERAGQGEASIPYTVAPNPAPAARATTLVVGSQSIAVNQSAAPCQFSLSRPSGTIGYTGGGLSVDLTTLTGCTWSASSDALWLSITSGQSGNASATVALSAAPNTGAERVARVNVGGQIYTVSQGAAPPTVADPPAPTPSPAPAPAPGPGPAPPPSPSPGPTTVQFSGLVVNLAGRCPDVTFAAGTQLVVTDESTDFQKSKCTDLRDGRSASGEGVMQANGTIKATQVEVKK